MGFDEDAQLYMIDYAAIIPLLVEGFKEQLLIIESLQSEIKELKKVNFSSKFKSKMTTTETSSLQTNTINTLYQNAPNTFSQST